MALAGSAGSGRDASWTEQRDRFRADEQQDAEHADDDGEAAERDDEDRGAIDALQPGDPLRRGRHLRADGLIQSPPGGLRPAGPPIAKSPRKNDNRRESGTYGRRPAGQPSTRLLDLRQLGLRLRGRQRVCIRP